MKNNLSLRIDAYKETDDIWHPSFYLQDHWNKKLVRVSLRGLNDGSIRVCVWGVDDFGLQCDFIEEPAAREMFQYIIEMKKVNQQQLRDLGFINT